MSDTQIALVGQPNCGKSTLFNMLTNIKQHIANYPGVTIDKKSGTYIHEEQSVNVIDLPGTYSFSSFSVEEKITRDYILKKETDVIVNTVDASNLRRNLYLTMQLFDMQKPMILTFNMLDVAQQNGLQFDFKKLSSLINARIVQTVATKKEGLQSLKSAVNEVALNPSNYLCKALDYKELQPYIVQLTGLLEENTLEISSHYLAVKLFENDQEITKWVLEHCVNHATIFSRLSTLKEHFKTNHETTSEHYIVKVRYEKADELVQACTIVQKEQKNSLSEKIDAIVLNKYLSLPILGLIIFSLYQLSIVYGYELTHFTWPILASLKSFVVGLFPTENIESVPYITQFAIWMMNSINALLNYIPVFFILFFCIAVLEDVGYMPRMAFILDRIFVKFGLHGESTLPLVLSGIFAGGCAVPGVMATKGMNDKQAQMATMLTVPLMNCLAKIPFFTLILAAFFPQDMALMMFLISTVTIFVALIVAKLLTTYVLKTHATSPFIMELPSYHIPTLRGILTKVFDRIWLYLKKIVTIVAAIAVILFVLIQFPGISQQKQAEFDTEASKMKSTFFKSTANNKYSEHINEEKELRDLINYYEAYKDARMNTHSKTTAQNIDAMFQVENEYFFLFSKPKSNKEARAINKALKRVILTRKTLFKDMKNEKIENSALGAMGKYFVPLTQFAGFDWKINVAFLSSFAARESSVATIGALYETHKESGQPNSMASSNTYTPIGAVAIIIFMAFTPPCIATMIMIRIQSNSYKWMMFAIIYPILLGLIFAVFTFQLGTLFNISGVNAMISFYVLIILLTLLISFIPKPKKEIYV